MVAGTAIQVAVGAGLSVVSGTALLLWVGPATAVPILLCLNLLISVVATLGGGRRIAWRDVVLASAATLAGCALAAVLPALPVAALKTMTAGVLAIAALPRPPTPNRRPSPTAGTAGVALAGLVTGALTVWTATPGPITPVALARAGRNGSDIRLAMQPISLVGYGAALAWSGPRALGVLNSALFAGLAAVTILGIVLGFRLRPRVDEARVVLLIRVVAAGAAILLLVSLLH